MGIHKALKKNITIKTYRLLVHLFGYVETELNLIQVYDLTVCLFDFEDIYYKKVKHNSIHLGHPFSNVKKIEKQEVFNKYNLDHNNKFISIPGSRESEIKYMLPLYLDFITNQGLTIIMNMFI